MIECICRLFVPVALYKSTPKGSFTVLVFIFFLKAVFSLKMSFQKVAEKLHEIGNCEILEAHLDTLSKLF